MYKVGICGHFGSGMNLLNGQTIKTKTIAEELNNKLGINEVISIDSSKWKEYPIRLLINCFKLVKKSKHVIILPARRGIKIFVPLFLFFNKFFNRKLHYVVIGGWLPEILQNNKNLKKQIKKFNRIYVETHSMVKKLNEVNLYNVCYLPNFKKLQIIPESQLNIQIKKPYKLCTFSRVMKEKGIEDAVEAVKKINQETDGIEYTLDIYGQIDKDYQNRFEELEKDFPSYISYKGFIDYDRSTEVLKNYFALLFPTTYMGEGFPGTVIDAFASGLPVIANDWKYNSEIIKHGETGLIYRNGIDGLIDVLRGVLESPQKLLSIRKNCIIEAGKYESETVINEFIKKMEML
jgi:glycosyltransferase involved in cell wall biosynthesis